MNAHRKYDVLLVFDDPLRTPFTRWLYGTKIESLVKCYGIRCLFADVHVQFPEKILLKIRRTIYKTSARSFGKPMPFIRAFAKKAKKMGWRRVGICMSENFPHRKSVFESFKRYKFLKKCSEIA